LPYSYQDKGDAYQCRSLKCPDFGAENVRYLATDVVDAIKCPLKIKKIEQVRQYACVAQAFPLCCFDTGFFQAGDDQ